MAARATKEQILAKLAQVVDPELGINIVDLGLVYGVETEKPKAKGALQKVAIRMTFTTPACPMMQELLGGMKRRLEELGEMDIDISITFDPPWTPDRMSEKARIKLGMI